jgi:hypothetical protein
LERQNAVKGGVKVPRLKRSGGFLGFTRSGVRPIATLLTIAEQPYLFVKEVAPQLPKSKVASELVGFLRNPTSYAQRSCPNLRVQGSLHELLGGDPQP